MARDGISCSQRKSNRFYIVPRQHQPVDWLRTSILAFSPTHTCTHFVVNTSRNKEGNLGEKNLGRGSDFFCGTARYDSLSQSRPTTVPYHSLERWVLDDCTCYFSRFTGWGWGVRKNLLPYHVSSRTLLSPVDVWMEPAVQLTLPSRYSFEEYKIDIWKSWLHAKPISSYLARNVHYKTLYHANFQQPSGISHLSRPIISSATIFRHFHWIAKSDFSFVMSVRLSLPPSVHLKQLGSQ